MQDIGPLLLGIAAFGALAFGLMLIGGMFFTVGGRKTAKTTATKTPEEN